MNVVPCRLLDCFNITQHVQGPTRTKGHLQCLDLAVADHHAILFSVPVLLPMQRAKRTITFRNTKTLSAPALTSTIAAHLASIPLTTTVDGLVARYNTALSLSLDSLAPLKTRTVSFTRSAPWFTTELRTLKASGRRLERLKKRTGLTVHREAYQDHVKSYKEALEEVPGLHVN